MFRLYSQCIANFHENYLKSDQDLFFVFPRIARESFVHGFDMLFLQTICSCLVLMELIRFLEYFIPMYTRSDLWCLDCDVNYALIRALYLIMLCDVIERWIKDYGKHDDNEIFRLDREEILLA